MNALNEKFKKSAKEIMHENFASRYYGKLKIKWRKKIRNKAIERARTRIYLHGRDPKDYDPETLEVIVKEEEDKLISEYKSRGLMVLVSALGLSLFS